MYRRIVLAFDGAVEGRAALREGAILAKRCGAQVFLLSVLAESSGLSLAEGALVGSAESHMEAYNAVLQEGLTRLEQLGFKPIGKLVRGEPAREIGEFPGRSTPISSWSVIGAETCWSVGGRAPRAPISSTISIAACSSPAG